MARTFRRALLSLLVPIALATTAPTSTLAAGDDASTIATQDDPVALFKLGKQLYANGKYDDSYRAYKKAYGLKPGYDIAANLGNVEVKLGKHTDAVAHLQWALDNLPPSLPERASKVKRLEELLEKAGEHVAIYRFSVKPDEAELRIDDKLIGTTPLRHVVGLTPGSHEMVIQKSGYTPHTETLRAKAGASETMSVSLSKSTSSPGTEPDDGDAGPSIPMIVVGAGVGLGAIAAGVGLMVVSTNKGDERASLTAQLGNKDNACVEPTSNSSTCDQIADLSDQEQTFFGTGVGLLVGGGAVAAATLVYALWPRGERAAEDGPEQGSSLLLLPQLGPRSGGLMLLGAF